MSWTFEQHQDVVSDFAFMAPKQDPYGNLTEFKLFAIFCLKFPVIFKIFILQCLLYFVSENAEDERITLSFFSAYF